jgi:FtsP/CotA-like multicopper oxidase with cupredoxin domain
VTGKVTLVLEPNFPHDRVMARMMFAGIALLASGCGDGSETAPGIEPEALTDINPDPTIVEVELTATTGTQEYLAGKPADIWGFRDGARAGSKASVPGPLLEANVGDTVIVHFKNELPEETTIHWHGIRVPNAADGSPVSQMAVPPGGTFDYEFIAKDAGYYWYHPHMHGDMQVEAGLYAPIIVHDNLAIDVAADRAFVLDDVKLESTGKLSTQTDNLDLMLGRQGNVVLINGRQHPTMNAAAGTRQRWRFVNAANGRYFNLELPGHQFRVIGWDGGLLETPYETATLLIAPGERYDVLVELGTDDVELRTLHYDRGHNIPDPGPIELLTIHVGAQGRAPAALPTSWGSVSSIAVDGSTPRRQLVLREDDTIPNMPVFTINNEAFPDITPATGTMGQTEVWEIVNMAEMDHPFHLHGMEFQQVDDSGAPMGTRAWKDTINVPQLQTVRFAVTLDAPGRWMYHCHILEHAERGMMGELEVSP